MASACRFAAMISRKPLCTRPIAIMKTLIPKPIPASTFSSSTSSFPLSASRLSRFASVLGSLETMLPLHSTIAAARLKSNIATDTACWSWLSQARRGVAILYGQLGTYPTRNYPWDLLQPQDVDHILGLKKVPRVIPCRVSSDQHERGHKKIKRSS